MEQAFSMRIVADACRTNVSNKERRASRLTRGAKASASLGLPERGRSTL
jgi:hypothetical protein